MNLRKYNCHVCFWARRVKYSEMSLDYFYEILPEIAEFCPANFRIPTHPAVSCVISGTNAARICMHSICPLYARNCARPRKGRSPGPGGPWERAQVRAQPFLRRQTSIRWRSSPRRLSRTVSTHTTDPIVNEVRLNVVLGRE